MTPPTSCSLAEQWIFRAFDGELSDEVQRELDLHLDHCAHCRALSVEVVEEDELLVAELAQVHGALDELVGERVAGADLSRPKIDLRASRWPVSAPVRWAAGIANALVAVSLVYWVLQASAPSSSVVDLAWKGSGVTVGGQSLSAVGERALRDGEWATVELGSSAELRFTNGSRVAVYGGTSLRVHDRDGETRVELASGKARFEVERTPREDEPTELRDFVVETPVLRVRVVGTRFDVTHDDPTVANGRSGPESLRKIASYVDVREGVVQIEHRHRSIRPLDLRAGESARVFRAPRNRVRLTYDDGAWEWRRTKSDEWVLEIAPLELEEETEPEEIATPQPIDTTPTGVRSTRPQPRGERTGDDAKRGNLDLPVGSRKRSDSEEEDDLEDSDG